MEKGKLVKHFRKRKGMTQEELAQGICSISYLSKLENGTIHPTDQTFMELCQRLKIHDYHQILQTHDNEDVIKSQLFQWLHFMEEKDVSNAKQARLKCKAYIDEQNFHPLHRIYLFYQLIYFRHLLFSNLRKDASDLLQQLNYYQDLFSREYIYYFKKFSGIYHYKNYEFNTACHYFFQAVPIAEDELTLKDADLYYYLALSLARLNKNHLSIEYAKKALDLFQSNLCYPRMIDTQMLLAINYNLVGDDQYAIAILEKILEAEPRRSTQTARAMAYHNLAYTYKNTNKQKALEYIEQAISLKQDNDRLNSLYLKSTILFSLNKKPEAHRSIQEGIRLSKKSHDKKYYYKFYVLEQKLKDNMYSGEFIETLENFILPLFKERGEYAEYLDFLELAGQVCYQLRHYKKASDYFKSAFETLKTIDQGGEIK
ncbi:MAG: helix-turn-helix domain-containing protein [Bacillaceae bacterium]|nr:helix-turn-helix domain-containing protein [Bacillaceae bacterium]